MSSATRRKAGIYTRISADQTGEGLGVERQEIDARKLCEQNGWEVVEVFCDNDRSAFSRTKVRPRYAAMLDAIKAREIDCVVAWDPDRLHRQMRELVTFVDIVEAYGVTVQTCTAGEVDFSTAAGLLKAGMLGTVAEYESRHKAERIRRKLEANAAEGKHHGGSRPYGWLEDRITLEPAEAGAVREAARLLLSGESVKSIARALNNAGHTTSVGRPWRDVTVRTMLNRPRNAAIRIHHGEEVGVAGQWEPILPLDEFRQIQAILNAPGRSTNPGHNGRVHLLSTIAKCGVCDGPIVVAKGRAYTAVDGHHTPGKSIYRCRSGHVIRDQTKADAAVTRMILARLSQPDAAQLLVEPGKADAARVAAERVVTLRDRLQDAAKAYAAGDIDLAMLSTIRADLQPQIDAATTESASPDRGKVLGDLVADPADVWEAMTPERRRAVVALLADVTILRTTNGARFKPDSIKVDFRV